jgi:DNA-binding transcriptional MerR regulator
VNDKAVWIKDKDAALFLGVTGATLRRYDKKGLLKLHWVKDGNGGIMRACKESDLIRFKGFQKHLRNRGTKLAELEWPEIIDVD